MVRKMLLLFLVLVFTVSYPATAKAGEIQDLEKVINEIRIGQPLPEVKYLYLPTQDKNGVFTYEGRVSKLELTVNTRMEDGIEIVKSYWVTTKSGLGAEWLGVIVEYYDKPTEKNEYEALTVYAGMYRNHTWMLMTYKNGITAVAISQK